VRGRISRVGEEPWKVDNDRHNSTDVKPSLAEESQPKNSEKQDGETTSSETSDALKRLMARRKKEITK